MPHTTSKIKEFQDIYNDNPSLGFRGEALYSLANLSGNLVIATRSATDSTAQKMEFRRDGTLVQDTVSDMPRKIGTTVAVLRLLEAVPVRRLDLVKRIKEHRSKLIQLVTGYAIFSTGVRINLIDMNAVGNEKAVLATAFNSTTLRDTVSSVLGTKFLACMSSIAVDLAQAVSDSSAGAGADASDQGSGSADKPNRAASDGQWKIQGLISAAGASRDKAKGQYFAINRRPVDLPKVARLLNESYRAFGGDRPPACVLEFTLPGAAYDINLSPDKRQVLLTHEAQILMSIQVAIGGLWASQTDGQFLQNASLSAVLNADVYDVQDGEEEIGDSSSSSRLFHRRYAFVHDPNTAVAKEQDDGQRRFEYESSSPRQKRRKSSAQYEYRHPESDIEVSAQPEGGRRVVQHCNEEEGKSSRDTKVDGTRKRLRVHVNVANDTNIASDSSVSVTPSPAYRVGAAVCGRENSSNKQSDDNEHDKLQAISATTQVPWQPAESTSDRWLERRQWQNVQTKFYRSSSDEDDSSKLVDAQGVKTGSLTPSTETAEEPGRQKCIGLERFGFRAVQKVSGGKVAMETTGASMKDARLTGDVVREDFSVSAEEDIGRQLQTRTPPTFQEADSATTTVASTSSTVWNSFQGTNEVVMASLRDRIAMRGRKRRCQDEVAERATADSELEMAAEAGTHSLADSTTTITLSKEDFRSMTVVGQFNMGFILARSQTGNLWIFDQHACDEKYNFEKLCNETVIHEQTLIAPMALELSPAEETCVLDHMDIFEKNGFRFSYDGKKPPRHRLSLTALPHSGARDGRNAVQYGKDDVVALCAILGSDEDTSDVAVSGGTGTNGTGLYGNNAVRRYAKGIGNVETAANVMARLPKTIAMFASRACRGSIMIGKALSEKEMDKIVKRLADIEHPWNCPHGRPTMRHVGDLQQMLVSDEKRAAEHIAGPTVTVMTQDVEE